MTRECLLSPARLSSVSKIAWNSAASNRGTSSSKKPSCLPSGLCATGIIPLERVLSEEEAPLFFVHMTATFSEFLQCVKGTDG